MNEQFPQNRTALGQLPLTYFPWRGHSFLHVWTAQGWWTTPNLNTLILETQLGPAKTATHTSFSHLALLNCHTWFRFLSLCLSFQLSPAVNFYLLLSQWHSQVQASTSQLFAYLDTQQDLCVMQLCGGGGFTPNHLVHEGLLSYMRWNIFQMCSIEPTIK